MTYTVGPPYRGVDWEDVLEAHPLAVKAMTQGLLRVEWWLKENAAARKLTLEVVQHFHQFAFGEVFPDFAGRIRGPAPHYLPHWASFGNYQGVDYGLVPDACEKLFAIVDGAIDQLDALRLNSADRDFDDETIQVAAYVHCELVRIHPFVNGNGRMARACINYFAWRYGAQPLSCLRTVRVIWRPRSSSKTPRAQTLMLVGSRIRRRVNSAAGRRVRSPTP